MDGLGLTLIDLLLGREETQVADIQRRGLVEEDTLLLTVKLQKRTRTRAEVSSSGGGELETREAGETHGGLRILVRRRLVKSRDDVRHPEGRDELRGMGW